MANFRLITSLLDYTPTASSEDGNFPVTNLKVIPDLEKKYQAAVATGIVNVTLDFGAGNTLSGLAANPGILIDDLNVTSLRIQGNSVTTDWVTPPWDQAITVTQNPFHGRYVDFRRLLDLSGSAFAYRYLNVRIPSQTPTDGANYRIGRVAVGQITEPAANPSRGLTRTPDQAIERAEMMDGGAEINEMGSLRMRLQADWRMITKAALNDLLAVARRGLGDPFVIWDAAIGGTEDAYLVRFASPPRSTQSFMNVYEVSWELEEVI